MRKKSQLREKRKTKLLGVLTNVEAYQGICYHFFFVFIKGSIFFCQLYDQVMPALGLLSCT